jgi:hypothetical protein
LSHLLVLTLIICAAHKIRVEQHFLASTSAYMALLLARREVADILPCTPGVLMVPSKSSAAVHGPFDADECYTWRTPV